MAATLPDIGIISPGSADRSLVRPRVDPFWNDFGQATGQ